MIAIMWVNTSGPLSNFQSLWEALSELQKTDDAETRAFLIAKLKRELVELQLLTKHVEDALASVDRKVTKN